MTMLEQLQGLWQGAGWFSWVALIGGVSLATVVGGRTWQKVSVGPDARWTDLPMTLVLSLYVGALWWFAFTWLAGVPVLSTVLRGSVLSIAAFLVYQSAKEVLHRMLPPTHPHMRHIGHR